MDSRQSDSRGGQALDDRKRRQFLAFLGISLASIGPGGCGGAGQAEATPTPFAFPATRPGHDSESGRR